MNEVSIRPFTQSDLAQTLKLSLNAQQEPYVGGNIQTILNALTDSQHSYVISDEQTIVGFYILDKSYSEKEKQEIAGNPSDVILRRFFIDQSQQGKGFASAALQCMIRDTSKYHSDAEQIVLTVNCQNTGAAKCYVRAGFVQEDKPYLGGTKGPQHIMRIDLPREIAKENDSVTNDVSTKWRSELKQEGRSGFRGGPGS